MSGWTLLLMDRKTAMTRQARVAPSMIAVAVFLLLVLAALAVWAGYTARSAF